MVDGAAEDFEGLVLVGLLYGMPLGSGVAIPNRYDRCSLITAIRRIYGLGRKFVESFILL